MAASDGTFAKNAGSGTVDDIVEIGLLLPASWANALLAMSKRRQQSVAQLVRGMIDRGLVDDFLTDP